MKKFILILILAFTQNFLFAQKNFLDQAYVEVSAEADTLVIPDRIYLSIEISEADSKNKKSVEQQERELEKALKRLQINTEKDLSLSSISSSINSYFLKKQNILKYKQYELLVRDATTAGKVLTALEQVGVSNVRISRLEYSKKEETLLYLKTKAISKTKKSAQTMTKVLNQKVGKAIFISDSDSYSYDYDYDYDYSNDYLLTSTESLETDSTPIETNFKKIKLYTTVLVKYLLD